jgi:hypothetical protein
MAETLNRLLDRTKHACWANAKHLRNSASKLHDIGHERIKREQLFAFAVQLEDRAAQCDAWLYALHDGVAPERESEMRDACAEWLRMVQ